MEGLKGLLDSKKAVAGGILTICSTVLFAMNRLTSDQWIEFNKWAFTVYASAEAATGITAIFKGADTAPAKPPEEPKP